MKWQEIKELVNKMDQEELKQFVYVHQEGTGIFGMPNRVYKPRGDLYSCGEDEVPLRTITQCKKDGLLADDIAELSLAISKGTLVIEF